MQTSTSSIILTSGFLLEGLDCIRCERWRVLELFCYVPCNCQVLLMCHQCVIDMVVQNHQSHCPFCNFEWDRILFSDQFIPWEPVRIENQLKKTIENVMHKDQSLWQQSLSLLLDGFPFKSDSRKNRMNDSSFFNSRIYQKENSKNILKYLDNDHKSLSKRRVVEKINYVLNALKLDKARHHYVFNQKKVEFENPIFKNIRSMFDYLLNKQGSVLKLLEVKHIVLASSKKIQKKLLPLVTFKCVKIICPLRKRNDAETIRKDPGYRTLEELNKHYHKCHEEFLCPICVRARDPEFGLSKFLTKDAFRSHLEHGETKESGNTKIFHPRCTLCYRDSQTEYAQEQRDNDPDLEYNHYLKVYFKDVHHLKEHLDRVHYKCPLCFVNPRNYYKDPFSLFKHIFECHKYVCFFKACVNPAVVKDVYEDEVETLQSVSQKPISKDQESMFCAFNSIEEFKRHLKKSHSVELKQYKFDLERLLDEKIKMGEFPFKVKNVFKKVSSSYREGINDNYKNKRLSLNP